MVQIKSDKPENQALLQKLCDVVESHGGYLDPNMIIKDQNGHTSVHLEKPAEQKNFIRIPHEALVPYDYFDFDLENDKIFIAHIDDKASDTHKEVMNIMIDMFNAGDKFKVHKASIPWLAYKAMPEVMDMILSAREGQEINILKKHVHNEEVLDELALLTFFKSRLIQCRHFDKDNDPKTVLMPIMELLNHDIQGAGFSNLYAPDNSFMTTHVFQKKGLGTECYANYRNLDAMDSFVHYDFVDTNAPFVRSVPIEIMLDDSSNIKISSHNVNVPLDEVPPELKGLGLYLPQIYIDPSSQKAQLSHILIPQEKAPMALRRILYFVVERLNPTIDRETVMQRAHSAENAILEKNTLFYESLSEKLKQTDYCETKLKQMRLLCETQLDKISAYKKLFI